MRYVLVMDEDLERNLFIDSSLARVIYAKEDTLYDHMCRIRFDVIILNREAAGARFNGLVSSIKASSPGILIFVTTSKGCIESYIDMMNIGIYEYFIKPFNAVLLESALAGALLVSADSTAFVQEPPVFFGRELSCGI